MHMFEHNFIRVFEESAKLDMFRVYLPRPSEYEFRTPFRWRANGIRYYPTPICTNFPRTDSFRLSSRVIYAISDCLLSIDNRGRLVWLFSSKDLINSSQRYSHILYLSIVLSRVACSINSYFMCTIWLNKQSCSRFDCHLRCDSNWLMKLFD